MRRYLLSFLLRRRRGVQLILMMCLFACATASAQTPWRWLNPRPHGAKINKIAFGPNGRGYAVGFAGTIERTDDGGATWMQLDAGTELQLYSVVVLDEDRAIVVGDSGLVLTTFNSGTTRQRRISRVDVRLSDVDANSRGVVLAVGNYENVFIRSTDNGITWKRRQHGRYPQYTVAFAND